ncbi:MAG TPA: PLP-dependent aminotransferase family protein [Pyrinomonadaceae bacterium]|nr:PLP-dependent aminotransferase family protein [Pyrinomonadaceae bacterium]
MTIWSPELAHRTGPRSQAIADALLEDIERGRLKPGARLPTHRELADKLGVAIGTVTRAYALAQRRGLLSGEVGRGTFVAPSPAARVASETTTAEDTAAPVDLSKNILIRDTRDARLFEALSSIGRFEFDDFLDHYQTAAGAERHRAAGAAWLSRRGFEVAPERVLVTSGAQHAMTVVLATLTEPGDTILTEQLSYPGIKALANFLHVRLRGLAVDEHGLLPEAFEQACRGRAGKVLYCIPTVQNPTASVMPDARRREIARIAREYDVALLEDDVYGFLPEDAPPPVAFYAPEQTFYVTSTSKSVAPGLRVGYVVAPAGSVERLSAAVRTTTWEAAPLMAEVVSKLIEDDSIGEIVGWKRREAQARQRLARETLGEFFSADAPTSCHIWIQLPEPWRSSDFVAQARSRGVLVMPSEAFVVGRGPAPHAVRICLGSTPSRAQLQKGLSILADILRSTPEPALMVT